MPLAIDHLGLAFAVYIFGAVALTIFLGRVCGLNGRLSKSQRVELAERREVDGSWSSFVAECSERRTRAEARHNRRAA